MMVTYLIIFFAGAYAFQIIRLSAASIPNIKDGDIQKFKATLPPGYSYAYYLDNTGYALNVEEDKIYLLDASKTSGSSSFKIYERSKIRKISSSMQGWEYMHDYRPLATIYLHNAVKKKQAKHRAYKDSGIFINVADIDHPTWQIRFSNEALMERNFEILHQFLDGDLPAPQAETVKS